MWVFTQDGYLSIVRHRHERGLLLVRSRDRHSLEEFCARSGLDHGSVEVDERADYRFRVTCPDRRVRAFLTRAVDELDYDNFKARASSTRGPAWHGALMKIWSVTRTLPTDEA